MDNNEFLARFGISKGLAYGLFFQSILVILAAIHSLYGMFALVNDFSLRYVTNFISFIVCICLLIYSFYGFNAKRNQEAFFTTAIILYIVLLIFGLITNTINLKNPVGMVGVVTLISTIFFLMEYRKNYMVANFAMLITIVSCIVVLIFNVIWGMPLLVALKYIIIPVTIGLTYFERTQRGKYDFKI